MVSAPDVVEHHHQGHILDIGLVSYSERTDLSHLDSTLALIASFTRDIAKCLNGIIGACTYWHGQDHTLSAGSLSLIFLLAGLCVS